MDTPYATLHLDSVASTQDEARSRFTGTPLLVVAQRQGAGRGRGGRTWLAAPRAVFASLAFTPSWPEEQWPVLSLVAGLAARDALNGRCGLKWPNDLVSGGGKLGGLLAEAAAESGEHTAHVVIGLGVNLWWEDPPAGMAALHAADPGDEEPARVATRWAGGLLERAGWGPERWGLQQYREACVTVGRRVVWDGGGPATVTGVGEDGALLVSTGAGTARLRAGEVRHVRAATLPAGSMTATEAVS